MGNHMPFGITRDFTAFTPAEAGAQFNNPGGMQG